MRPVLQALLLADRVYEDKTGKKIICGTFSGIKIGKMPVIQQQLPSGQTAAVVQGGLDVGAPFVYLSLTDVVDGTKLELEVVNREMNQAVLKSGFMIKSDDRLKTHEFVIPLPPIRRFIRDVGVYSLDVIWSGEILGSHRLVVTPLDPKASKGDSQ